MKVNKIRSLDEFDKCFSIIMLVDSKFLSLLLQVACRGRNEVPDPESVNTFVFEVMKAFYAGLECFVRFINSSVHRGFSLLRLCSQFATSCLYSSTVLWLV